MLSLTVFLAYLTDITPSNSDTVPEVAIFVFLHLTLGACGVVGNILLLKLHFNRLQRSQKRVRKMTERLWTASTEEQEGPAAADHRKNTTLSLWTSSLDENVDEEKEESSSPRKGRKCGGSNILQSRILSPDSTVSDPDRVFYPRRGSGSSSRKFSDVTRDHYFSLETSGAARRIKVHPEHNNNHEKEAGADRGVLGRPSGSHDLQPCRDTPAVASCLMEHLGNTCFVLFLFLSVLVSGVFFLKNI